LKVEHDACEFLCRHFFSLNGCVAYAEVLAEDAEQITTGEENRAAASPTPQAIFLTQVWSVTADFGVTTNSASSQFVFPAIGATLSWANTALAEHLPRSLNLLPNATASVGLQVNGFKLLARYDEAFAKLWQSSRHPLFTPSLLNLSRSVSLW